LKCIPNHIRVMVLLPLSVLCACAAIVPKLEAPRLQVTGITLGHADAQSQQLQLTVHATNPNDRSIEVRSIDCQLTLAGNEFARCGTEAPFTLPALGAVDFPVDVTADMSSVLLTLAGSFGHHDIDYRISGTVHLAAGVLRNIPFNESGRVRLH
jgi:LEA14-like dessication related protein